MSAPVGTREPRLVRSLCDLLALTLGVGEVGFAVEGRPEWTTGSAAFRAMDPDTAARLLAAAFRIGREGEGGAAPLAGELVCRQRFVGGRPAVLFALFPEGPRERDRGEMIVGSAATFAADLAERLDRCAADANAHDMLRRVEEVARVGGFAFDPETLRFSFSEEVFRIHGLPVGQDPDLDQLLALYPRPARDKLRLELERAAGEGAGFDLTTPVETADGRKRTVRTIARARLAGKRVAEVYGTVEDVTAEIESEHRGWWAANHDPLTGLANRLLFDDRLSGAIRRARRTGEAFALVLATLSRPRAGAAAGGAGADVTEADAADAATRIAGALRESDTLARIAPHDFALLLPDVSTRAELSRPLARLGALFCDGEVDVAFGAALYPRHGRSEDALMRAADVALLKARAAPGRTAVYDRSIAEGASRRRESVLERAREALANGHFVPYYQPQVDIVTSEIVGAEALVRWKTPNLVLDAKDFAFALDDQEIGGRVGKAILSQVVEDMQRLGALGERPFRISVNASRNEVLRNDYLETFLERVRAGHLDGSDFIIEITEDVIIGIADQKLHDRISYLASNGVEFSLDDFGTGYASLIHITSFPIKEIKIDKQFIAGIETDRRKRAIVRGIVSIARSIGLNVIAEGVETYEQEDVLRSIGCRYAQGYLYAFPMPFEEFAALVEG